ncbi:MAG: tetratricopeptide repeat protein [Planctomycetaceae bacterium]
MYKYRQILPLLLLVVLTGCNAAWKPKWMSRFRPKSEDRRTVAAREETQNSSEEAQRSTEPETQQDSTDAELAVVERQTRLIRDAQTALRSSQLDKARRLYQDVLNDSPDHPDAHHGLAMAADLMEDWGDAEYHYKQALRIRPRDAVLLSDIGYSYVLQNRYSEAARYLNQAIELQPNYERAHMNLALLDIRQGNRTAAEQRLVQRLGNSAKTRGILASLEQQAFPDDAVAAAPTPENRQPDAGMNPEQQRNERAPDRRTPEPWFRENTQPTGTPAATVSDTELQPLPSRDSDRSFAQSPPEPNYQPDLYPAEGYPSPGYQNPGYQNPAYQNPGYPDPGYQNPTYPDPGYAHSGYPNSGYASGGYPNGGYSANGYPSPNYPSPNYPAPNYPSPNYSAPNYPSPNYSAPNYPAPNYPAPAMQQPAYPAPDYGYPQAGDPPQEYGSADQPDSADRPSGKLALSGPATSARPKSELSGGRGSASSEAPAGDASWSSSNAQSPGSVAVTPPVPIRSSSTGTTVGAESYGQPAGFNRSLPGRMRVSESGNGQSGFPVYGTGAGFRTEGLNIGPGALFPAVEPQRGTAAPQRTVLPAGYSEQSRQGGVIPAWGAGQRRQNGLPARESNGASAGEYPAGSPAAWPPVTAGPGMNEQSLGQPDPSAASVQQPSDRALQPYRDQLQQIDAQFNRQAPPANYNDNRR